MSNTDILLRLLAAFVIGAALGLNRDLHKKSAGVRTIGLVCIASAMVVMAAGGAGPGQPGFAEVTRIIQGVLTGVGFIGAGVIVRGSGEGDVHGLTTAAVIWLAAGFGVLCGMGAWIEVVVAIALVFVLLVGGGPIERLAHRVLRGSNTGAGDPPHGGDAAA